jgi:acylphosphatase
MDKFETNRRHLLTALASAIVGAVLSKPAVSEILKSAQQPNPKTFETGDIVWPKPPGVFVPYAGTAADRMIVQAQELQEEEWNELRIQFIRAARADTPDVDPEKLAYQRKVADIVETMPYTRFFHEYTANVKPDDFQTYGIGQIAYVGHVAIIEVDAATKIPYVIEAVFGPSLTCKSCVQRVTYADWLKARGDILVWHGRVRNVDAGKRAAIATEAKQQLNKPYRFFNFDLLDDSGFYCSKLLWYSVLKATGIALDGNPDSRRFIWFSPLQAMQSKSSVELLSSPGNYRNI